MVPIRAGTLLHISQPWESFRLAGYCKQVVKNISYILLIENKMRKRQLCPMWYIQKEAGRVGSLREGSPGAPKGLRGRGSWKKTLGMIQESRFNHRKWTQPVWKSDRSQWALKNSQSHNLKQRTAPGDTGPPHATKNQATPGPSFYVPFPPSICPLPSLYACTEPSTS